MGLLKLMLLAVVVVVALSGLALLMKKPRGGGGIGFPYRPSDALFSSAERAFLVVLDQAVGPEYRVFGKVRLADLAIVKGGIGHAGRRAALNRVAQMHLDFVVCNSSDLGVICGVELKDASQAGTRGQARDALVQRVCEAIDLPLIAMPATHTYSAQEIRSQFLAAIAKSYLDRHQGNIKPALQRTMAGAREARLG